MIAFNLCGPWAPRRLEAWHACGCAAVRMRGAGDVVQLPMDLIRNASRAHPRTLRDLETANGATVMLWPDDALVVVHAASAATATKVLDLAVGVVQGVGGSDRGAARGGRGDTASDGGSRGEGRGQERDGRGGRGDGGGEWGRGRGDRGSGGRGGGAGGADVPPWRQAAANRAWGEGGSGDYSRESEYRGRRSGRYSGEQGGGGRGAYGAERHGRGRGRGRDGARGGRGGEGRGPQEGDSLRAEKPERETAKERPALHRPTRSDTEE